MPFVSLPAALKMDYFHEILTGLTENWCEDDCGDSAG